MKKLFLILACVAMSVLAMGQDNQLVWANGRLLYGTPIESIDSLTYDEMQDIDTLHLLLPRTLIKVVHDTVYIHDTVYVETDCGEDTPSSAGIGVFSVSADKQVTFSKGNLQYTQSTNTWSFAENQYDYLGQANIAIDADILADKPCQNFIGSRSTYENLSLIKEKGEVFEAKLEKYHKEILFEDLSLVLSEEHLGKIWDMLWLRWCKYEKLCNL